MPIVTDMTIGDTTKSSNFVVMLKPVSNWFKCSNLEWILCITTQYSILGKKCILLRIKCSGNLLPLCRVNSSENMSA